MEDGHDTPVGTADGLEPEWSLPLRVPNRQSRERLVATRWTHSGARTCAPQSTTSVRSRSSKAARRFAVVAPFVVGEPLPDRPGGSGSRQSLASEMAFRLDGASPWVSRRAVGRGVATHDRLPAEERSQSYDCCECRGGKTHIRSPILPRSHTAPASAALRCRELRPRAACPRSRARVP